MSLVADLLQPEPSLALDPAALGQALAFAFATGGTGEDFERILNRARVGRSRFRPESFARDLFLSDFVQRCVVLRVGGREQPFQRAQLLRELSQPPSEASVIEFRQAVLKELVERPELRAACEETWSKIRQLIALLEAQDRGKRYDPIARRLEILRAVREAVDRGAAAFQGTSSGLSRIHDLCVRVQSSHGYRDLVDLLDHEAHRATLDLRVRVAQDGQVRSFEIVSARENSANPLYVSPFRRFFTRLRALVGGYRLRESEIMGRLLNHVFDGVQDVVVALFQLALHLEFHLAALSFRDRALRAGLAVCLPELEPAGQAAEAARDSEFSALFNPLLLLEPRAPRPCDLRVGARSLVVITGPNSGGKTRLLQAVGLAQLLGQSGMFVPARRARLLLREGLFVSLIQESAADQPEGRLGMELLRIRRLFEQIGFNELVIMDELCSGTNPSEGEEIFQLVVGLLAELEPQAFITTHFLQFAARLARERALPNLEFLRVELDARNDPTYGFVPGVAPTSLAGRTAERLGVTREALEALVDDRKREHGRAGAAVVPAEAEADPGSAVPLKPGA